MWRGSIAIAVGLASALALKAQVPFSIDTVFSASSPAASGFPSPWGLVIDTQGNLYVSDCFVRNQVFRITAAGVVSVIAGTGVAGFSGDLGPATAAKLNCPSGLGLDGAGDLFIVDSNNFRIRKVTPDGTIRTVAGNGFAESNYVDGIQATSVGMEYTQTVGVDSAGNFYYAYPAAVVRVNTSGVMSTAAGPAVNFVPSSVALDASGRLLVGTSNGIYISTSLYAGFTLSSSYGLAGNATRGVCYAEAYYIKCIPGAGKPAVVIAGTGLPGFGGDGGAATSAPIDVPVGMVFDAAGNLFFVDAVNTAVRKVTPDGIIMTVWRNTSSATVKFPAYVATDSSGALYVSDESSHVVWRRATDGTVSVVAGIGVSGFGGDGVLASDSTLFAPAGIAVDSSGRLFIAETGAHRVRVVGTDGIIQTLAGTGSPGFSGDGGPATGAALNTPEGVAVDTAGNVFVADTMNNRVRQISPNGIITTVAGSGPMLGFGTAFSNGDNGSAAAAQLNNPGALAVGLNGDVYVADENWVRRFHPGGTITEVAGTGACDPANDGGPATAASLCQPGGIAVSSDGFLYISSGELIRRVDPNGLISTVAGTGSIGFSGDGGPATNAQLNNPRGIAVDGAGNLYIADLTNARVRRVPGGTPCALAVSSNSVAVDGSVSSGYFTLDDASGCSYSVASDSSWLHLNSASQGNAGAAISYSIDSNPGSAARRGSIKISGPDSSVQFLVFQAGAGCQYTLPPSPLSTSFFGSDTFLLLNQSSPLCASFSAQSDSPWLQITGATAWAGAPSIAYRVLNNMGPSRNATLTVGNQSFTVIQDPSPVAVLSPTPGTALNSCSKTFQWSSGGASQFRYELSTSPGLADIASGYTTNTSVQIGPLPDGNIYFRLWSNVSGIWLSVPVDASYVAPASCALQTVMTSAPSGSGNNVTMSFTFFDSQGWQNLGVLDVLINNSPDGRQACYFAYVPQTNTVYLVDDGGDAGGPFSGALLLNGSGSIGNSQCQLNGAGSSAAGAGRSLTLTIHLTFAQGFAGNRVSYLAARTIADSTSGWTPLGTWTVPGAAPAPLTPVSVTPASGNASDQIFSFSFSDVAGWQGLGIVNVLINGALDGRQACYVAYAVQTNSLFLVDDGGDSGGPFAGGMLLSGSGTVANSQCTIHAAGSSVTHSGNTLTLTLHLSFSSSFAGNKLIYTAARDTGSGTSGWQPMGTWIVQ